MTSSPQRRRLLAAFLLLALLGFVAMNLWAQNKADDSLQRVRDAGVLRVGLEATFPPFETTDGLGNLGGFDVDLANALAQGLGVRAQFDNLSYDTLYDALAARRVDVLISMIIPEPERTMDVSYSSPYYDAGLLLVVRQDQTEITAPKDLGGHRVAVEAGSVGEEEARRLATALAGMTILTFSEPGQALAALGAGEAAAAISDPASLAEFRRAGGKVAALGERLASEPYAVATRQRDRALTQEIQALIERLRATGELDRMAGKWF